MSVSVAILKGSVSLKVVLAVDVLIVLALVVVLGIFINIALINLFGSGVELFERGLDLGPNERRLVHGVGQIGLQAVGKLKSVGSAAWMNAVDVCTKSGYLLDGLADVVLGMSVVVDLLGVSSVLTGNRGNVDNPGLTETIGVEIKVAGLIAVGVGLEQAGLTLVCLS